MNAMCLSAGDQLCRDGVAYMGVRRGSNLTPIHPLGRVSGDENRFN